MRNNVYIYIHNNTRKAHYMFNSEVYIKRLNITNSLNIECSECFLNFDNRNIRLRTTLSLSALLSTLNTLFLDFIFQNTIAF